MQPTRIAELLRPFLQAEEGPATADEDLCRRISRYIDILLHWNARINLSAIREPEEIVTRHFGESLFAARHLFPKAHLMMPNARVADLGSGAGFPGIPIRLLIPGATVTLIESNHKKATFLREVVRSLELTNVAIENSRAENLHTHFDLVTLRAVERFSLAVRVAAGLVGMSGHLALLISSQQFETARAMVPGFSWEDPIPVPLSDSRILVIGRPQPK